MKININKIKQQKTISELLEFGIINIDKPSGPTSFNVSDFIRKKSKPFGVRKTSHFGTLDPKVTGVLPIALNRACKLTGYFIGKDKEYVGVMRTHKEVSLKEVEKAIKEKFLGKIIQMPPVKSRVARVLREREIKKFQLLEKNNKDILFCTRVQGGTYIRKLISDLGDHMKIGMHMLELRRTKACIFEEEDKNYPSVNLFDFEKAISEYEKGNEEPLRKIIIPAEIVSELYPVIEVKEGCLVRLFTGKPILYSDLKNAKNSQENFGATKSQAVPTHRQDEDFVGKIKFEIGETVCVFSENKFVGMYEILNAKNSQENFGATKSQAVPTHRQDEDFVGHKHAIAKPKFVLQPIKK